jgi:creatinine amidohydrolase/Fe(II)-dependent formamide hydrolase-like protein
MTPDTVLLEEMTWPEIGEAIKAGFDTVIVGVGAIEQHGLHLAEGTDAFIGQADAELLARRLGKALVGPVIRPGVSPHHLGFPGTVSLRPETLAMIVEDYAASYYRHGFRKLLFFCSHGGNYDTVRDTVERLRKIYPDCRFYPEPDLLGHLGRMNAVGALDGIDPAQVGAHSGDSETSQMLALFPQHVRMDRAKAGFLEPFDETAKKRLFTGGTKSLSRIGVLGDPGRATAERGHRYVEATVEGFVTTIRDYDAAWDGINR